VLCTEFYSLAVKLRKIHLLTKLSLARSFSEVSQLVNKIAALFYEVIRLYLWHFNDSKDVKGYVVATGVIIRSQLFLHVTKWTEVRQANKSFHGLIKTRRYLQSNLSPEVPKQKGKRDIL